LLGAAWYLAAAPALGAQVTSALDAAVSRVHYDGFLPSAGASLGGALAARGRGAALSARGSALLFESGNATWQASLAGAYFTPRLGPSRPELWAVAGGSRYAYFPSFWHTIAGARIHFPVERGTVWLDGSLGRTAFGDSLRPVTMLGAGLRTQRFGPTVTLAASYVRVGDTTYTDVQATARARRGTVEIDGVVGSRLWSAGGGRGVYAEATLAVPLGGRTALVVSGGRYPTDPWRGTISGRYVSAGVRIRSVSPTRRVPTPNAAPVFAAAGSSAADNHTAATSLEIHPDGEGLVRLVIHAAGVATVEVVGDFTDWQPLALSAIAPGVWQAAVRMAPGTHRLNVRLDGGPWFVPAGATRSADDYGGEIGIVVIP
jgi:hypothetical protein